MNDPVKQLRVLLGLPPNSPVISDQDTVGMAELCLLLSLPDGLSTPDAESIVQMQIMIGQILSIQYKTGNPTLGISYDPAKEIKYVGLNNPEGIGRQTEALYNTFGWFSAVRLFTVRLMRTLRFIGLIPARAIFNNISTLTSIGGLSYGVEFIAEISVMIKTAFSDHLAGSRWSRFKTAFWKGNRPHRLANAFVWFSVNLACFFLTGGLSSLLNTALFVFDVFNDSWKAWREISAWHRLEKTLGNNIRNSEMDRKSALLLNMTRSKISHLKRTHALQISITITVLIGMVFIFFPPAGLTAAAGLHGMHIAGAAMTLSGSILGGLGRRIYRVIFPPVDPSLPAATVVNSPDVEQKNLSPAPTPSTTIFNQLDIDHQEAAVLCRSESDSSTESLGKTSSTDSLRKSSEESSPPAYPMDALVDQEAASVLAY